MAVSLAITVVVAYHAADMIRKIIGRLGSRLHPPHVDHLATGLLQQGICGPIEISQRPSGDHLVLELDQDKN